MNVRLIAPGALMEYAFTTTNTVSGPAVVFCTVSTSATPLPKASTHTAAGADQTGYDANSTGSRSVPTGTPSTLNVRITGMVTS